MNNTIIISGIIIFVILFVTMIACLYKGYHYNGEFKFKIPKNWTINNLILPPYKNKNKPVKVYLDCPKQTLLPVRIFGIRDKFLSKKKNEIGFQFVKRSNNGLIYIRPYAFIQGIKTSGDVICKVRNKSVLEMEVYEDLGNYFYWIKDQIGVIHSGTIRKRDMEMHDFRYFVYPRSAERVSQTIEFKFNLK